MKNSAVRGLKSSILEQYPSLSSLIDELIPKKGTPVYSTKCQSPKGTLYEINDEILFVQPKNDIIYPTLRLAMSLPGMLPTVQADKGAVRPIMKGSNIMAPGLTSEGGDVSGDIEEGVAVAVMVEGKSLPIAIGRMNMSAAAVREESSGIAVLSVTYLGDGLWKHEK